MKITCTSLNMFSFKGMPKRVPSQPLHDADDAIKIWGTLKHPQYTEIFHEEETPTDSEREKAKQIRDENYSFLDEIYDKGDKAKFVEYFCKLTGFPKLDEISEKILDEFKRVLYRASYEVDGRWNRNAYDRPDKGILMAGYDEFCSVGQKTALPGSDIDKACAIVVGPDNNHYISENNFSNEFKGRIWDNIDNRIMSVNHESAFPNIMTLKELKEALEIADRRAEEFVTPNNQMFFWNNRLCERDIIGNSKFNIFLSQVIPSTKEKYDTKNLAYIVEALRDGKIINLTDNPYTGGYDEDIMKMFGDSPFACFSNVIESKKMQNLYDGSSEDALKPKLKARKSLEKDFDSWSVDEKYELVKDVIRSMSGDNKNPEYKNLFYSPEDKGKSLINDILRGKVACGFSYDEKGNEYRHFHFNDGDTLKKYRWLIK